MFTRITARSSASIVLAPGVIDEIRFYESPQQVVLVTGWGNEETWIIDKRPLTYFQAMQVKERLSAEPMEWFTRNRILIHEVSKIVMSDSAQVEFHGVCEYIGRAEDVHVVLLPTHDILIGAVFSAIKELEEDEVTNCSIEFFYQQDTDEEDEEDKRSTLFSLTDDRNTILIKREDTAYELGKNVPAELLEETADE